MVTQQKLKAVREMAKECSEELAEASKQALKDYVESVRPPKE